MSSDVINHEYSLEEHETGENSYSLAPARIYFYSNSDALGTPYEGAPDNALSKSFII